MGNIVPESNKAPESGETGGYAFECCGHRDVMADERNGSLDIPAVASDDWNAMGDQMQLSASRENPCSEQERYQRNLAELEYQEQQVSSQMDLISRETDFMKGLPTQYPASTDAVRKRNVGTTPKPPWSAVPMPDGYYEEVAPTPRGVELQASVDNEIRELRSGNPGEEGAESHNRGLQKRQASKKKRSTSRHSSLQEQSLRTNTEEEEVRSAYGFALE